MAGSSRRAIYAALMGNAMIAVTKFAAASYTGSAAMLSEGIHSLVDTGNQILLLFGLRQATKPTSPEFPFGHGKEVYFWCFIVAMLIFALGGALSIYQGVAHLQKAEPPTQLYINYLVLGAALLFEGGALWVAVREFNRSRGAQSFLAAVRDGKDPTLFVVVFEDSAATLGLLIAMMGLLLYQWTGMPLFDALASIAIGVVLILTAAWLAKESKNLLIGESASPAVRARIVELLETDPRVGVINEVATLHMGPEFIVVTVSAEFSEALTGTQIIDAVTQLNVGIKAIDARIRRVFVEAERYADHVAGHQVQT